MGTSLSSPMFTSAGSMLGQKHVSSLGGGDSLATSVPAISSVSGSHLVSGTSSSQSQVSYV